MYVLRDPRQNELEIEGISGNVVDVHEQSEECNRVVVARRGLSEVCNELHIRCVYVPANVETIPDYCFARCTSLEEVEFKVESRLRRIGQRAFYMSCLKGIKIPESTEMIGEMCFAHTTGLVSVVFDSGTKQLEIRRMAFHKADVSVLCLPARTTKLGTCFCDKIQVVVDDGNEVFRVDSHLVIERNVTVVCCSEKVTSVTIPDYVRVIRSECFRGCQSLVNVEFAEKSNVVSIEKEAFAWSGIKHISVPASVRLLCESSFIWCKNLKSISFEEDSELKVIGTKSFLGSGLRRICIPSSVRSVGLSAFRLCKELMSVTFRGPSRVKTIARFAFCQSRLQSIVIPASVEIIEDEAFKTCMMLNSVTFEEGPNDLEIGRSVFLSTSLKHICYPCRAKTIGAHMCSDLVNCEVASENAFNTVNSGVLFTANMDTLISHGGSTAEIVIPRTVTVIGEGSFLNCTTLVSVIFELNSLVRVIKKGAFCGTGIQKIYIPASVELIDRECFMRCSNLNNVEFERNSRLYRIEKCAFYETGLTHITIPSRTRYVSPRAYERGMIEWVEVGAENRHIRFDSHMLLSFDCHTLLCSFHKVAVLVIPANIEVIGSKSFSGDNTIETLKFESQSKATRIERKAFYKSSLKHISIPSSITVLEERCFAECGNLESVDIESSSQLVEIGSMCFSGSSLKRLVVPKMVIRTGDSLFTQSNISELSVESGSFSVHSELMLNANRKELLCCFQNVSQITVPRSVEVIGDNAFRSRKVLNFIEFEDDSNLRRIGKCAFSWSGLKHIHLPPALNDIDPGAFCGCDVTTLTGNSHFSADSGLLVRNGTQLVACYSDISYAYIPRDVEVIADMCFLYRENLAIIDIDPSSRLRSLGIKAFGGTPVNRLHFPRSLNYIGALCFTQCIDLERLVLPNPDIRISPDAFHDTGHIISITEDPGE